MVEPNPIPAHRRPWLSEGAHTPVASRPKGAVGTLRRHLWLVLISTLFGTALGVGGWQAVRCFRPQYRAETILQVVPAADSDPQLVAIAGRIESQDALMELLAGNEMRNTEWFRNAFGDAEVDVNSVDPVRVRKAIAYLQSRLEVLLRPQVGQIVLSMTGRDASETAAILNEVARQHTGPPDKTEQEELAQRLIELNSRRGSVERQLRAAERELERLRAAHGIGGPPAADTQPFDDIERDRRALERRIEELRANIGNLQAMSADSMADEASYAETDLATMALAQQLTLLRAELAGRLTKFGPDHSTVRQTQEQITQIEAKLNERRRQLAGQKWQARLLEARNELIALEDQLALLQQMRDQAQAQQRGRDNALVSLDEALEQRDMHLDALSDIETQIESIRLQFTTDGAPTLEQLSLAAVPVEMVWSRTVWLWISSGILLGLLVGLSLAALVEKLNDQVRTGSDASRVLGLSVLSVVPDAGEDPSLGDTDLCQVVRQAPYSLLGESYRRCRTNIDLSAPTSPKVLLIASGQPADGKTSVACNLAQAFAATREKVLLIDANLRQPRLHLVFPRTGRESTGDRRPGLTSILTGQCPIKGGIRPSGIAGLHLIYAGPPTSNPADLLAGRAMKELIRRVGSHYDRVIIDSPPVLLVSDVKVMARAADATVLVVHATATRRGVAERTIRELAVVGATVIGCVLFGAESMAGGYFRKEFKAYRDYLKPQVAASSA